MTLLNELKKDLKAAIDNYQTSRPFKRKLREERARDVADFLLMIDAAESGVMLKQKVNNRLLSLKAGFFSPMAWLDLNALRVRLNNVFKEKKYSTLNLLISENSILQASSHFLQNEVQSLRSIIGSMEAYSPSNVDCLTQEVQTLREQVQNQAMQYQRLESDNTRLLDKIAALANECKSYQERADQSERQFESLHQKYLKLLQENDELKQELEAQKNGSNTTVVKETRPSSKPFFSRLGFT